MTAASRRLFLQIASASGASLGAGAVAAATPARPVLTPRRLRPGDTVGLVSPANATYEQEPITIAIESLQALGFQVKEGRHLRARRGQFAGTDAQRAEDINAMFADDSVAGIFALTGGSGCTRIVDLLDYASIRRHPKFFGGFSDITCLLNAIQQQTGLVTFHGPVASSEWNPYSVANFRALVMDGQAALLRNPVDSAPAGLVPTEHRITTLRPGKATGRLVGGNLTVLAALAGSRYWPDFRGAILFLEDINEFIYRVDRTLSTLRLAGALDALAGVVLGQFTNCEPGDGYGTLTLDEVFEDYFGGLGVPVYRGAQFGHVRLKLTLPVGAMVEMDAQAGTLRCLAPVVAST